MASILEQYTTPAFDGDVNPQTLVGYFGAATEEGSLLICTVACVQKSTDSSAGPPTIGAPQTLGLNWKLAGTVTGPSAAYFGEFVTETVAIYYCPNAPSIAPSVGTNITFAAVGSGTISQGFQLYEISGTPQLDVVDVVATGTNPPSGQPAETAPIVTTLPSDFIITLVANASFGSQYSAGPGGWTQINTGGVGSEYAAIQYLINQPPGTYPTTFGPLTGIPAQNGAWAQLAVAFGTAPAALAVSPASLNFNATAGNNPASQQITVSNDGGPQAMPFSIASDSAWLTASPLSGDAGEGPVAINVILNAASLGIGSYSGNLTITAPGALDSPIVIPVSLVITGAVTTYTPITYPLVIPGPPLTPGPSKANLKKYDAVGEFISPWTGQAQEQQNQDQHWELDLGWPEMNARQFAPLDAFTAALHGKLGTFLWGPPLATGPRGSGLGQPVATSLPGSNGSSFSPNSSGSNLLGTGGWLPNQQGVLMPGDYFSLVPAGGSLNFNPRIGFVNASISIVNGVAQITLGGTWAWLPPGQTVSILASVLLAGTQTGILSGGPFTAMVTTSLVGGQTTTILTFSVDADNVSSSNISGNITLVPTPPRLYLYTNPNPLATDGGGNAVIDIFPALREVPLVGAPLTLLFPQGTFRLAENRRESPATKTKSFTLELKCREAI